MITVKISGLDGVTELTGDVLKAARYSVADATKGATAETVRLLANRWNIKARDLSARLAVRVSGVKNSPEQTLTITGNPISASYFGATQIMGKVKLTRGKDGLIKSTRASRAKGPQPVGVMVEMMKGRRTLLRQAFMRNARNFAGRAKGGALLYGEGSSARVFSRYGKKINAAASISIPSMFLQSGIEDKVAAKAQEHLDQRFNYHMDRLLSQAGQK